MRIAILELPATWGDPQRALDETAARLATAGDCDLALLPEAALCGYVSPAGVCDPSPFAEPIDGPTARRCAALAREHRVHLVAPLVLAEDDATYNAMACWDRSGALVFVYRKRHPWMPETWATAGSAPLPVVAIADRRVTIAVCYDVHFLPDDGARELTEADVLLFPSAWVEEPDYRAARLVRLARRFDVAIANANWAPGVVRVPGQGGSCAIGRDGSILARAALGGTLLATL